MQYLVEKETKIMALILYSHPLASYCWKAIIALYENGTPFETRMVNLGDPAAKAEFMGLWPTAKMPLLDDNGTIVPETSIIIEYIDQKYPGKTRLFPSAQENRLEARLWDRIFYCYVMDPMQRFIAQQIRSEDERDARTLSEASADLTRAYDLIETKLGGRAWAAGDAFTIADCAAAPALFYASTIVPFSHGVASLFRAAGRASFSATRDWRGSSVL